jgi:hypothetical protein
MGADSPDWATISAFAEWSPGTKPAGLCRQLGAARTVFVMPIIFLRISVEQDSIRLPMR